MTEELYVVRHGQRRDSVDPDWAATADRVHDPPLTELGRWAAWRVGRRFAQADTTVGAVYRRFKASASGLDPEGEADTNF